MVVPSPLLHPTPATVVPERRRQKGRFMRVTATFFLPTVNRVSPRGTGGKFHGPLLSPPAGRLPYEFPFKAPASAAYDSSKLDGIGFDTYPPLPLHYNS